MAETLTSVLNQPVDPFSTIAGVVSKPTAKERGEAALRQMPEFMRAEGGAREEAALKEASARREKAQAETTAEQTFATGARQAQEQYQAELPTRPEPQITQFNSGAAAEAATLTAILGAAVGTVSARGALKAMEGFTKGYREGNEELYKREVAAFERELGAWKDGVKAAQDKMNQVIDLLGKDKNAALVKAKELEPLLQDGVVLAKVRQQNFAEAKKLLDDMAKLPAEIEKQAAKSTARQAGSRELLFAGRVFQNIVGAAQDLGNLMISPAVAQSPVFTGLINVDPDTMFGSLRSLVARKVTKAEERAFDQVANSLSAALARIEAQGLASGSTKANIAAFDALRPRAGDSAINMALYLARVKQEIEVGIQVFSTMSGATEEQKRIAADIEGKLDKVVPFSVDTVFQVMTRGGAKLDDKMQKLLKLPNTARLINPNPTDIMGAGGPAIASRAAPAPTPAAGQQRRSFATEAEADAAFARGEIGNDQKITIGGRNATYRAD